jgi:hypothetical protein
LEQWGRRDLNLKYHEVHHFSKHKNRANYNASQILVIARVKQQAGFKPRIFLLGLSPDVFALDKVRARASEREECLWVDG